MQGILKSNHQRLCNSIQDIKAIHSDKGHQLNELEEGLESIFIKYQEKINELKCIVHLYGENEKLIRNEVKRLHKDSVTNSKKISSFTLSKVTGFIIFFMQHIYNALR